MTVCALVMRYRVLSHAGPLWRDEINGLNVALMPTWKEIWRSIIYYPFPLLHDLLLRVWIAIGFGKSDFQLRIFSFLTAIWVLVAIWLSCGIVDRRRAPLWPLAL